MPQLVSEPVRVPVPGGRSPAGWAEPAQTPEFDEVTLVLAGAVHVEHVAVCVPAFTPDTVHRED